MDDNNQRLNSTDAHVDSIRAFNVLRVCIKKGLRPYFTKAMTDQLYDEIEQKIMAYKPLYALLEHNISLDEDMWVYSDWQAEDGYNA